MIFLFVDCIVVCSVINKCIDDFECLMECLYIIFYFYEKGVGEFGVCMVSIFCGYSDLGEFVFGCMVDFQVENIFFIDLVVVICEGLVVVVSCQLIFVFIL